MFIHGNGNVNGALALNTTNTTTLIGNSGMKFSYSGWLSPLIAELESKAAAGESLPVTSGNDTNFKMTFQLITPPTLVIALHAGIQFDGTVGLTYRIEYTTNLATTNWSTLANIVLPSSPYTYFDPSPTTEAPKRFYRVSLFQ